MPSGSSELERPSKMRRTEVPDQGPSTDVKTTEVVTTTASADVSSTEPALTVDEEKETEAVMNSSIEVSRTYERELDYRNKLVLAPMVRTGACELQGFCMGPITRIELTDAVPTVRLDVLIQAC